MTSALRSVYRKVTYTPTGKKSIGYQVRLPTAFVATNNKRFAKVEVLDKDTVIVRLVE